MSRFFWIASLLLGIVAGYPAVADSADDLKSCADTTGTGYERILACTRVIESGGEVKWAFVSRGNAYFDAGDNDSAIGNYTAAIRIDPKYATAVNNRAYAYMAKGDLDRALADSKKTIQLEPKDPSFFDTRGAIYQKMGALDRAIGDFDQAIRLDPQYPGAFTRRGLAYEAKNDFARARADYQAALALPIKYKSGAWARDTAREHLNALPPPAPGGAASQTINVAAAPPGASPGYVSAATPPASQQSPAETLRAAPSIETARASPPTSPSMAPPVPTPSPATTGTAQTVAIAPAAATPTGSLPARAADPAGATAGRRVALVIGNSNYAVLPLLPTPHHDAEDMTTVLKGLDFEVLTGIDLKRLEMEEVLIRFARLARNADTALVYYAGHGIQHNGENYLASVDATFEDEADLRKLSKLRDIIGDLQGASRGRILIVDACRVDEVVSQAVAKLPGPRAAAFGSGLAWVSGAEGTLVTFAAQANHTAADGKARNSPFTQALLKQLPTPGIELRTVMTRVRSDVVTATNGAQRPELFDSLAGELVLRGR
jgi:tetratricopeptide (TPR) repeat protein